MNNHEDSYEDGRKDDDEGDVSVQGPMVGMMMVATMHMMMSIRSRKTHANYDCLGDYQVKEVDDTGVHAAADNVMMMTTMIMTMVTMTITTLVPVRVVAPAAMFTTCVSTNATTTTRRRRRSATDTVHGNQRTGDRSHASDEAHRQLNFDHVGHS